MRNALIQNVVQWAQICCFFLLLSLSVENETLLKKQNQGFTLVELIIVVAIIAVLFLLAVDICQEKFDVFEKLAFKNITGVADFIFILLENHMSKN